MDKLLTDLAKDYPAAKAAAEAAKITGHKKPELYKRLLSLKD
ncbi:hypothetical protein [Bartonella apis]